jgi:hypothetical protein
MVEVTNTWKNRLVGDANLPENKRQTWVAGSGVSKNATLAPAGLIGPVTIQTLKKV